MAAPSAVQVFAKNINQFKLDDLTSANIRLALVSSSATVDTTVTGNTVWANLSANEISGGTGYTSGGYSVTGSTPGVSVGIPPINPSTGSIVIAGNAPNLNGAIDPSTGNLIIAGDIPGVTIYAPLTSGVVNFYYIIPL